MFVNSVLAAAEALTINRPALAASRATNNIAESVYYEAVTNRYTRLPNDCHLLSIISLICLNTASETSLNSRHQILIISLFHFPLAPFTVQA